MKPGTPTPWHIDEFGSAGGAPVIVGQSSWRFERDGVTGRNRQVAKVLYEWGSEDPEVHPNAAYTVHAANLYPELVEALRDGLSYSDGRIPAVARWRNDIRALLAKCDGAQ